MGLGSNPRNAVVLEFEHRRKTGRGEQEWFYFPLREAATSTENGYHKGGSSTV